MRLSISLSITLLFSLTIVACGEPTIDGSSDETFKQSVAEMREGLSEEQGKELTDAMMVLLLNGKSLFEIAANEDAMNADLNQRTNGKTYLELLAMAKESKKTQALAERKKLESDIAELEAKQDKALNTQEKLKALKVVNSRFYWRGEGYTADAIEEISLENNLTFAVSSVSYDYKIITPGRSVAWVKESGSFSISGGLEPGESKTLSFSGSRDVPKDQEITMTMTITKVEGPNSDPTLDGRFSEYDQDELVRLKERLSELE
jgi:hypothetical protein